MTRPRLAASMIAVTIASGLVLMFSGCTSILGDFELGGAASSEAGASETGPLGRSDGEVCQTGSECSSGSCMDGVCCESACDGVCESCALEGSKGRCAPIPAGADPEKECVPAPRPDAGANVDEGDGVKDGGAPLNVPDSGLTSNEDTCVGACDGNRKCAFPGPETTCGTRFCNSSSQSAAFACDSRGRCDLDLMECGAFTCQESACMVECAKADDCVATHFCNSSGKCQKKLADGIECGLPTQCASGFCVDGVCCNSECNTIPGGTCKATGKVGVCSCQVSGCTNGCRLFYKDKDNDNHGDQTASLAAGTAVVGCVGVAPPPGFVASKDDCNDDDGRVFPGQTSYFATGANVTGSFDFDCSGSIEKETREYPQGQCRACAAYSKLNVDCKSPAVCTGRQQAGLACQLTKTLSGPACLPDRAGFVSVVKCGDSGKYVTCGVCVGDIIQKGVVSETVETRAQRCR